MGLGLIRGARNLATGGWKLVGNLGTHAKGALLVGGASYGGWKYITTGHIPGEGLLDTAGNMLEKTGDIVTKGLDAVDTSLGYVNKGLENAPELIHDTREALLGSGDGTGVSSGQGGSLLGNLFGGAGNLLGGMFNGGIGSLLGLVAGAFLLFGRFGWLGKIGGVLLAALSLGLFRGTGQSPQQLQAPPPAYRTREQTPVFPVPDADQEENSHTVHRSR